MADGAGADDDIRCGVFEREPNATPRIPAAEKRD